MPRLLGNAKSIGVVSLSAGLLACGRPPLPADSASETGFGEETGSFTTVGPTDTGPAPTDTGPDTGEPPSPGCDPINLGSDVNFSISGNTSNLSNDYPAPCVDTSDAPDALYLWRAPFSGEFVFDTYGSAYDTALVLRGPYCDPVLDCNDDAFDASSQIVAYVSEGDEVVIQVDGYGGDSGFFQLNIGQGAPTPPPGPCPIDEIWEVPWEWYGNNEIGSNQYSSECGGADGQELGFFFVPPFDGLYYVEAWGEYPTLLSVRQEECDGPELACSEQPWMEVYLNAGVPVVLMIDSHGGPPGEVGFYLDYLDAPPPPPPPGGECPEGFLPSETYVEVFGSTAGAPNSLGGFCGGEQAPDHTYEFIAPVAGEYRVRTAGSEYDTLLHVRRDGCDGEQVACNDDTWELLSQVFFLAEAGERFIITVDGFDTDSGPYRLEVALQ